MRACVCMCVRAHTLYLTLHKLILQAQAELCVYNQRGSGERGNASQDEFHFQIEITPTTCLEGASSAYFISPALNYRQFQVQKVGKKKERKNKVYIAQFYKPTPQSLWTLPTSLDHSLLALQPSAAKHQPAQPPT